MDPTLLTDPLRRIAQEVDFALRTSSPRLRSEAESRPEPGLSPYPDVLLDVAEVPSVCMIAASTIWTSGG